MNLLDKIHAHLAAHDAATIDDVWRSICDTNLISRLKVIEDLIRLERLGRVTRSKGDLADALWSVTTA